MLYNQHNLNCAAIAGNSEMRPEINGVFFTSKLTCATDSVCLLEIKTPSDVKVEDFPVVDGKSALRGCHPFIVSAKSLRDIKIPNKNQTLSVLNNVAIKHLDSKRIEFLTTDLETANITTARRIEGNFPDYEKIFPVGEPTAQVLINGKLLAKMLEIMAKLEDKGLVKIKFFAPEKPVVLEAGKDNQKGRGLIMPLKE